MNFLKLGSIIGNKNLFNEVISSKPKYENILNTDSITVFFGGDVQDYPELMSSHRDHGKYIQWNLLNMVTLLSLKFPSSIILIIKPNRMEFKTFSCYDHFVSSNELGTPTYKEMHGALSHLKNLISNSLKELTNLQKFKFSVETNTCNESNDEEKENIQYIKAINLVGFSKGCVVLNQLISEVHTLYQSPSEENEHLIMFLNKVRSIYWLDGGHSGGSNTWITRRSILHTLASIPNLSLHVHVTPYQVRDERRPWIRKECKCFVENLKRHKADITYKLHFEENDTSLENHFRILDTFK